jgi:Rhodopirellula transposase DDE domain
LIESETAGDPMSDQKWQRSSLRHLSNELTEDQHPDRDQQFEQIESLRKAFLAAGQPVISVDTKKKELIGNFKNAGQSWCLAAEAVNDHDFDQDALGKAVPYGIYDLNHNLGYVYVGNSADTPSSQSRQLPVGGRPRVNPCLWAKPKS